MASNTKLFTSKNFITTPYKDRHLRINRKAMIFPEFQILKAPVTAISGPFTIKKSETKIIVSVVKQEPFT